VAPHFTFQLPAKGLPDQLRVSWETSPIRTDKTPQTRDGDCGVTQKTQPLSLPRKDVYLCKTNLSAGSDRDSIFNLEALAMN